ncbi:MAG: Coenzyme F420 hydrogenase/dehydrogenase, beta subunit C-terminal domain [Nitrososphaerota archaeon]|nr:Coenzyme F420 hydrogenase/dehydrogenase, beta subunit C-terminal domain [Nitrososphaerota archaeon]
MSVPSVVCSGCGVCISQCPNQALGIVMTREGFLRPSVEISKCTGCHLCEWICPFTIKLERLRVSKTLNLLLGDYLKIGLSWSTDNEIRFKAASGGAVISILKYLLEHELVDAVLLPRAHVRKGLVLGVYEVVDNSRKLIEYSGSIYAPTVISGALRNAINQDLRFAVVALPCQAYSLRRAVDFFPELKNICIILGLYCNNVPSAKATRYVVKFMTKNNQDKVVEIKYRGNGWPGLTYIRVSNDESIRIPFPFFWDSGFGQYFYDLSCLLCTDHTAEYADISFSDPWTHQRDIGVGKTLLVVRTEAGLKLLKAAMEADYIVFEEFPSPLYAVQYTTLLKKTKKVTTRTSYSFDYVLPPSISTITHELDYRIGSILSHYEKLWVLLRVYSKFKNIYTKPLCFLDYKLRLGFSKIVTCLSKVYV